MAEFVLASSSPRRRELMDRVARGRYAVVIPGTEESFDGASPPEGIVERFSREKAESAAGRCSPGDVIIAADTIVWHGGTALGKPKDRADAARMLRKISGGWHKVYTGLTVRRGNEAQTQHEVTSVKIRALDEAAIERYIATGEPMDKAGAYGIQGMGALLVERVEGDFFNVMGLPLHRLKAMLKNLGIELL